MKILDRSIRLVPMVLIMGTIFFLSHQPAARLDLPYFPGLDKLAHAVVYFCLALAVLFAVPPQLRVKNPRPLAVLVVVFCLVYGISDEFHQSFIPGRQPSLADLLADAIGSVLAVSAWMKYGITTTF